MDARESFGVRLRRQPWNVHDIFAIRVMGFWTERRLLVFRQHHELHIGHLPKGMARTIARKVGYFTRLGACLIAVEEYEGTPDFVFDVLARFRKRSRPSPRRAR